MRKPLGALSALTAVIALTLAGCGGSGSAAPGGSDSAATPASTCPPKDAAAAVSISEADHDAHVCIAVGQKLRVILNSEPENLWQPIIALGDALSPTADGTLSLVRGATGAAFVGAHAGEAIVNSTRACPTPSTGTATCLGVQQFQATVTVR